jgi:hypothetical protein
VSRATGKDLQRGTCQACDAICVRSLYSDPTSDPQVSFPVRSRQNRVGRKSVCYIRTDIERAIPRVSFEEDETSGYTELRCDIPRHIPSLILTSPIKHRDRAWQSQYSLDSCTPSAQLHSRRSSTAVPASHEMVAVRRSLSPVRSNCSFNKCCYQSSSVHNELTPKSICVELKHGEFHKLGAIVYNDSKTVTMAVVQGFCRG